MVVKEILREYKDRLVNISGRNRSLILRKIYQKRAFDVVDGFNLQNKLPDSLVDYLRSDSSKWVDLIDNDIRLEAKVDGDRQTEMTRLAKNLSYLQREVEAKQKETGQNELYIGYPFVEGRFADGTFVRGPVYLFPVELKKEGRGYQIRKTEEVILNKVLLFAAEKCHQINYEETEWELDTSVIVADQAIADLAAVGLQVEKKQRLPEKQVISQITPQSEEQQVPQEHYYEVLTTYTKDNLPDYSNGQLYLREYMVLGQFPISNSIYRDYELLEEVEGLPEQLKQLLENKEQSTQSPVVTGQPEDIFAITKLDFAQENAVRQMATSRRLVIYGPPGTGKSQTIANMISDSLVKGKRVLVVSQKRAALDVLYNRLSTIQTKLMLIHDGHRDKKAFLGKIADVLDGKVEQYDMGALLAREKVHYQVLNDLAKLEAMEQFLIQKRPFGLSLQEMMVKTKGIFSKEDERYTLYREMQAIDQGAISQLTYDGLKHKIKAITERPKIMKDYRQWQTIRREADYLPEMTRGLSFLEMEAVKNELRTSQLTENLGPADQPIIVMLQQQAKRQKLTYQQLVDKLKQEDYLLTMAEGYHRESKGPLPGGDKAAWWQLGKRLKQKLTKTEMAAKQAEYRRQATAVGQQTLRIGRIVSNRLNQVAPLAAVLTKKGQMKLEAAVFTNQAEWETSLTSINQSLEQADQFADLISRIQLIQDDCIPLLDYLLRLEAHRQTELTDEQWLDYLTVLPELAILNRIQAIESSPSYTAFSRDLAGRKELINRINSAIDQGEVSVPALVNGVWNDKFQVYVGGQSYKEIKRQAEKKRRRLPIRKMVAMFREPLFTLFPCWLLSPETVSDVLPLMEDLFDVIIFDEASQIFIENAIPTIYRGSTIVVAGDDKQLRPTSTFMAKMEDDSEEEIRIENAAAMEEESLLDLAKINYEGVHLNFHYRSHFAELIQFSNYAFYHGRLNVSPNKQHHFAKGQLPIERIKVEGVWHQRQNQVEAERIVDLVATLFKERVKDETIGIITFNITQKDLIEDLLEARCLIDKSFKEAYNRELGRRKGDEDISIFVKNIENVQGDERDIIIFSVGYAKDERGKLSVNFGSLSQDGGENRLNVAISRAKRKIYLVTSIEPEELKVADTKNFGAKAFKQYLSYAKAVSDGNTGLTEKILYAMATNRTKQAAYSDEMIREIGLALHQRGYQVAFGVGSAKYQLDMAIFDKESQRYLLGIEVDSSLSYKQLAVKEREIYRQRFYQARKWQVMRIASYEWWRSPEKVMIELEKRLADLKVKEG